MCFVYVIENEKGRHYIGCCGNLESRLRQHNDNCVSSTKNKGPFKVIYKEEFATRTEALKRENRLKSYKGNSGFLKIIRKTLSPSSSLV